MEDILLPSKIELTPGEIDSKATLVVEPCYYGYGTTLGNALRRVMLSSLPGAAITAVKIKGAQHEFAALDGVKEDVLEIILNLKEVRMRVHSDEPVRLKLSAKGEKEVTGADIEPNADVEVVNPDVHIATLTDKKSEMEMEIFVQKGRGYVPVEDREDEKLELGTIAVDAIYSPIREIGYKVENARVGDVTNYDKLVMTIETDGTITPKEALDSSVRILLDQFGTLVGVAPGTASDEEEAGDEEEAPAEDEEASDEEAEEEDDAGDDEEEKPKKKSTKKK